MAPRCIFLYILTVVGLSQSGQEKLSGDFDIDHVKEDRAESKTLQTEKMFMKKVSNSSNMSTVFNIIGRIIGR